MSLKDRTASLAFPPTILSLACLAAVTWAGCSRQSTQPPVASEEAPGAALITPNLVEYAPAVAQGTRAGAFPTAVPAYTREPQVLGHAIIHDGLGLMAGVREAAPPMMAGMINEESLRGMFTGGMRPQARDAFAGIRFDKPYACVVVHLPGAGEERRAILEVYEAEKRARARQSGSNQMKRPDPERMLEAREQDPQLEVASEMREEVARDPRLEVAQEPSREAPEETEKTEETEELDVLTNAYETVMDASSVACAIPYDGGIATLRDFFKARDLMEDTRGHGLAVSTSGDAKHVFFDELGEYVVWTIDLGGFEAASSHLQRVLEDATAAASSERPQLEVTVFASSLYAAFPSIANAVFEKMEDSSDGGVVQYLPDDEDFRDQPDAVRVAFGEFKERVRAVYEKATKVDYRGRVESVDQITLTAGVQAWGLHVGAAATPTAKREGNLLRDAAARMGDGIADPSLPQRVPGSSFAILNGYASPTHWDDDMTEGIELGCSVWSALLPVVEAMVDPDAAPAGREGVAVDPQECADALVAWTRATRATGTGHFTSFAMPAEGAILGVGSLRRLKESARPDARARLSSLRLDSLVGERLASKVRDYVTFTFQPSARSVGGVAVDEGRASLTDKSMARLTEAIRGGGSEAKGTEAWAAIDALVGRSWSVQWAEVDGVEVTAFGFEDTDAVMDAAVAAARGDGAMAGNSALMSVVAHHPTASTTANLDPAGMMAWLRGVFTRIPGDGAVSMREYIPTDLAGDLSSIGMYSEVRPSGHQGGQLVVGTDLIVDVVMRVMAASRSQPVEEVPYETEAWEYETF